MEIECLTEMIGDLCKIKRLIASVLYSLFQLIN